LRLIYQSDDYSPWMEYLTSYFSDVMIVTCRNSNFFNFFIDFMTSLNEKDKSPDWCSACFVTGVFKQILIADSLSNRYAIEIHDATCATST